MKLEEVPNDKVLEPLKLLSDEELSDLNTNDLDYAITHIVEHRGPKPNLGIIDEYRAKEKQFIDLAKLLEVATEKRNEVKNFLHDARQQRYTEFTKGFQVVNHKLKEVFRMISMGGDAELELQDTFNPFLEGIAFSVRPRNKAWTQIDRLSGGEKTLSSLALIFGLHYYKPSPFYMMDEIDAALDARNVSIIGHYIKQFTINCQFIVISLRPEMYDLFERRVVGIFKPDGCSRTGTVEEEELADEPSMNVSLNDSAVSLPETPAQRPTRPRKSVQPVLDDSLSSLSGPDTDTEVPKQPLGHVSDSESSSCERPSPKKKRLGTVPPSDDEEEEV
ncbi:hypothetical protein B566_EDAN014297 [Ephemera danica]|nr:hypothetical protein B566_EDAN014297 [Ephemera danica]